MRTKGESRKSPQKPALPSRIEFSILGPNWLDDTYFEGIRIKTTPSPEKLPSPSQQEVVTQEEATDSVSSSNEGSPENSIVGGWMPCIVDDGRNVRIGPVDAEEEAQRKADLPLLRNEENATLAQITLSL